jgi:hypothetical protein
MYRFLRKRSAPVHEIPILISSGLPKQSTSSDRHLTSTNQKNKINSSLRFTDSNSNPINGRFHELSAAKMRQSHEKKTRYKNLHKSKTI